MTISVTINFISYEEAITALAKLRADAPGAKAEIKAAPVKAEQAQEVPAIEPEPVKVLKGNVKQLPASEKVAASTRPSADAKPTIAAQQESAPSSLDYDTVSKAIAGAVANGKRSQAVEVLTAFGAKSGKDLKPAQYADFMAKLAAATTEEALA